MNEPAPPGPADLFNGDRELEGGVKGDAQIFDLANKVQGRRWSLGTRGVGRQADGSMTGEATVRADHCVMRQSPEQAEMG